MNSERLFFNGVNGTTGEYLTPPLTPTEISQIAQSETFEPKHLEALKKRYSVETEGHLAPIEGIDPKNLGTAGWGVIFAHGANSKIKDALGELLNHRRNQAGDLYREYSDWRTRNGQQTAYFPGETANEFLARFGAASSDPVDPYPHPPYQEGVPYYLLLVGDPEAIPYSFQYQLDVQYAVGRIYFENLEEYAQYAHSVVQAETNKPFLQPVAKFLSAQNPNDLATKLSSENLVKPLAQLVAEDKPDWNTKTILDTAVTKTQLGNVLGGPETPALLFTASHGVGFDKSDPKQLNHQGALLVSDGWHPEHRGAIPEDWYFSADDLSADAKLLGLIAFHFACYGAGTPKVNDFGYRAKKWPDIAPHAFVARLPQKLLSHEKGGALAVVGHVERAWGYSFGNDRQQLGAFKSTLKRLMEGHSIGSALEYFNQRYAALSSALTHDLDYINRGMTPDDVELSRKWIANNDARGYAIIGDPAVRLMVLEHINPQAERPALEKVTLTPSVQRSPIPEGSLSTMTSQPASPSLSSETSLPTPGYISGEEDVEFGVFDATRQAKAQLTQALNQFMTQLGNTLNNITTLEVSTYTSDDMTGVTYNFASGKFEGTAKLRALTRIALDGDTVICVPEKEGKVDESLWKTHADMVQQAQTHRAELLKVMVSTATGLLGALKVV